MEHLLEPVSSSELRIDVCSATKGKHLKKHIPADKRIFLQYEQQTSRVTIRGTVSINCLKRAVETMDLEAAPGEPYAKFLRT